MYTFSDVLEFFVTHHHIVLILVLAIGRPGVVVVIVRLVLGLPGHFILLFQPSPGVREPRTDLGERHFGDDGQHDLLALGRIRIFLVFVQPRFEGSRRFSRGVLPPSCQIVSRAIPIKHIYEHIVINTEMSRQI